MTTNVVSHEQTPPYVWGKTALVNAIFKLVDQQSSALTVPRGGVIVTYYGHRPAPGRPPAAAVNNDVTIE